MSNDQPPDRRIRLATGDDFDSLVALALGAEGLMTTMPRDPDRMAERIEQAEASVDPARVVDGEEIYFFVLDEGTPGSPDIAGTSAIYAAVGLTRPFYNYRLTRISKYSPDIGHRFDYTILQPSNDYTGCTEVGTLYLPPEHRGGGRGRMLSLARFMFIAVHRQRFGDVVMAEMRGWTDDAGRSPFWEAVGQKFFGLDLEAADLLSGKDFRFMQDLLPGSPIHVDLLPDEARAVISVPHAGSEPAAAMLRRQGLRDHGYIDIFDAGLCLDAFIDDVEVIRRARSRRARITEAPMDGSPGLIANTELAAFSVIEGSISRGAAQPLTRAQADALGIADGDPIVTYIHEVPID